MSEPVFDTVMQTLGAWWAREWPEAVLNADALIRLDNMLREEVKPDRLSAAAPLMLEALEYTAK